MRTRSSLILILLSVVTTLCLVVPAALAQPRDAALDALAVVAIQQAELTAGDGAAGDRFGVSVALSGDTALVGPHSKTVGASAIQGAAYVYTRSGGVWTQQQELTASDGAAGDRFGVSVALSGDTALIGASGKTSGANVYQGAAYVFTRTAGVWTQQQKLTASDAAAYDLFGGSVALSGESALVGARRKTVGTKVLQGAAYVFTRTMGVWTQQQKLTADDGAARDVFGVSVALAGDTALVGAPDKTVDGKSAHGAAYVFTRNAGLWTQQRLTAADSAEGDQFGYAVALSGDAALVGAYGKSIVGSATQGAAYVFTRSAGVWSQHQRLTASDDSYDLFGSTVALSGDTALVGASFHTVGATDWQGAACLFTSDAGVWTQQQRLTGSDAAPEDEFGSAVALSGDSALVGAPGKTVGINASQGSAYVFVMLPAHTITASAGPHGSIAPSGAVNVADGSTPTFTFTPEVGSYISAVTVDGAPVAVASGNSYTFPPVSADHTIVVSFAQYLFGITVVPMTGGGSVSPRGTTYVPFGGTFTVSVAAAPHYHVERVVIDGAAVAPCPSYTFVYVNGRHRLEASFALDSYAIRAGVVSAADGRLHGTITPPGTRSYRWGANAVYRFTPESGYAVFEVRVDGVQLLPTPRTSYTFAAISGPHVITVKFVKGYVPTVQ